MASDLIQLLAHRRALFRTDVGNPSLTGLWKGCPLSGSNRNLGNLLMPTGRLPGRYPTCMSNPIRVAVSAPSTAPVSRRTIHWPKL